MRPGKGHRLRSVLVVALTTSVSACGGGQTGSDTTPSSAPPTGPPTAEELGAATYSGFESTAQPVALANGVWEGTPFVEGGASRPVVTLLRGSRVTGDVDGDGEDEAIVLLAENSGGSGTLLHIAVVDREGPEVVNTATRVLGDRVQVRDLAVEDGGLRIDVVRTGPRDPACCPGELATYRWLVAGSGLVDGQPEEVTGRMSLAMLAGQRWRLRRFDRETPVAGSVEVTLRYEDGRLRGSAGCNPYAAASVDRTEGPAGGILIGPPTSRRRTCDAQTMAVEERYLHLLAGTVKFSFGAGRLLLHYPGGAMAFVRDARGPG
jgi:heat shock protein HslJ